MSATAHTSDADDAEALLHRCAGGDRAAFRLLYDRWGSRLYGIALRITRQGASAADAPPRSYLHLSSHNRPAHGVFADSKHDALNIQPHRNGQRRLERRDANLSFRNDKLGFRNEELAFAKRTTSSLSCPRAGSSEEAFSTPCPPPVPLLSPSCPQILDGVTCVQ